MREEEYRRKLRIMGKEFTSGAVGYIAAIWALGFVALLVADELHLFDAFNPRDATDSPVKRSGMALMTDYGTGCQYLRTPQGFLTPRLDAEGNHICKGN